MTKIALVNHTDSPVQGWFPTNIDWKPAHPSGSVSRGSYRLGLPSGLDSHNLDVYCRIEPHEYLTLDFADAVASPPECLPPIRGCDRFLGGPTVKLGETRMEFVASDSEPNGAAYDLHYTCLVGPMLRAHLWIHWYPDQKWAPAELMVVASNPAVQDVTGSIPENFRLKVGEAIVTAAGLAPGVPLMSAGDWLANAQPHTLALTLTWIDGASPDDLHTAWAWFNLQIAARGVKKLHFTGNPHLPSKGFDALNWTNTKISEVIRTQHDWLISSLDPQYQSNATGAQGGQSFVGGPGMADPSAIGVIYLAGLTMKWPMVHCESDGRMLDWNNHPNLRMFFGQPNTRICSDWLGKPRLPNSDETHNFAGPEDEHWFDFTETEACRYKSTRALQFLLEAHGVHFLFRWVTVPPGNWLSANRAMGWLGMLVSELVLNLRNRELAGAIETRFKEVFDQLIYPQMFPGDAWWSWTNDPRIGASDQQLRAMPWQAEVMCVGMQLAGMITGHKPATDMAYHMAKEILRLAWVKQGDRWWTKDVIAQDGADLGLLGAYDHFGMKAVDVMMMHDPANTQALEIYQQRVAEAQTHAQAAWFVPR